MERNCKSLKCTFVYSPVEVQGPFILSSLRVLLPRGSFDVFERFVALRGIPELIISDGANTFKAAATQLTKIVNVPDVIYFLLERKIQWKFNLEKAP